VVLAGGQSTRMGRNKALLRITPEGPTLVETVVARLQAAGMGAPLLVTNTPDEYAFLGLPMVADEIPGGGPLGGVLTGLVHSPSGRVFAIGCDMPFLSPALVRYMASIPDEADVIIPSWTNPSGHPQLETLHAIYSHRCIEPVRARIASGRLKLVALLEDVQVRYLSEAELRTYDPKLDSFRNINTPEEWAEVKSE